MKHCQRCNLNFPDSLRFCESCGGALGQAVSLRCPACGETAQPGWKFCVKCRAPLPSSSTGDLANAAERSTLPPTVPLVSPTLSPTAPLHEDETTHSSQRATISDAQVRVRCRSCRKLVDEDAEFCEFCGASMFETTAPLLTPSAQLPTAAPAPYQQTYDPTPPPRQEVPPPQPAPPPQPREERSAPTLSILSSYGDTTDTPPATFRWWHGLLVAIFVFMVFAALVAGGWYWWSHRGSEAQSSPQPAASPAATASTSTSTAGPANQAQPADNELKQFRAWRLSAPPADAKKILAAIEAAEEKYPTDYRFPYERAKLSIKGMISHHEAFEAIFAAGEKAIDNGKAVEMLNDLMSDKDGDFYKMSRGHHEWEKLEAALRNKDKSALTTHHE